MIVDNTQAILLAAGEGTRMKSKQSKVLHKILDCELIQYVYDSVHQIDIKDITVIGGDNLASLEDHFQGQELHFVEQKIGENYPYGTGYAVSLCADYIDPEKDVLILTGDTPLIRSSTLEQLVLYHQKQRFSATVLTATIDDASGYGRIVKDDQGLFLEIIEEKNCTEEQKKIQEFNSGILVVKGRDLLESLTELTIDEDQNEMYLTDIFAILRDKNKKIGLYQTDDAQEVYGINSKRQLASAENIMRKRVNKYWMDQGVILENPDNIFIGQGVTIGQDTYIASGARLAGDTKIGADTRIIGPCLIENTVIGDGVEIVSSTIRDSIVKNKVQIGPNAHIRPESIIEDGAKIGNFVEIKKSHIGRGSKVSHLTYVGDSIIGERVNIGAGTVFANYDGKNKFTTRVGDDSFIGSQTTIISPIEIGNHGFTAAGSVITEDVPANSLAIARGRQVNKIDWAKAKEEQ